MFPELQLLPTWSNTRRVDRSWVTTKSYIITFIRTALKFIIPKLELSSVLFLQFMLLKQKYGGRGVSFVTTLNNIQLPDR